MKSHDLNALTLDVARDMRITFAAARSIIGRRGAIARQANRRRTEADRLRADHARAVADRISP